MQKARLDLSLSAEVHSVVNFILVNYSLVDPVDWQKPGQSSSESLRIGKSLFAHLQVNDVEETHAEIDKVSVKSEIVIILKHPLVILLKPKANALIYVCLSLNDRQWVDHLEKDQAQLDYVDDEADKRNHERQNKSRF